jgi:hypothetical protein
VPKTFLLQIALATALFVAGLTAIDAQETSPKDVTGHWQVTRELTNGGQDVSMLDLKRNGSDVSGTFTGSNGKTATIQDGRLVGESLTFSFSYANMHLDVSGQILSDHQIDLTVIAQDTGETIYAVAERKETPSAGGQLN